MPPVFILHFKLFVGSLCAVVACGACVAWGTGVAVAIVGKHTVAFCAACAARTAVAACATRTRAAGS